MRVSWPILLPCLALGACSGRYEVGVEELPGTAGRAAGGGAAGGSSSVGSGPSTGGGSAQGASPGCAFLSPQALPPPFAAPTAVWARISSLIFDEQVAPLGALPAETTSDWAGAVAVAALERAQLADGAAPGTRRFLQRWLGLAEELPFERDWAALLGSNSSALALLLTTPLGESERTGVFSEMAWLSSRPTLTRRGLGLVTTVWGFAVPTPPAGVTQTPPVEGSNLTRRQQMEQHVANPACSSCHVYMDPLGTSLEHFDQLGEYRTVDGNLPVDSSGEATVPGTDVRLSFTSMLDLAPQLAESCQAVLAFSNAAYDDAQVANGFQAESLVSPFHEEDRGRVSQAFGSGDKSYRSLVQAIAQSGAFLR